MENLALRMRARHGHELLRSVERALIAPSWVQGGLEAAPQAAWAPDTSYGMSPLYSLQRPGRASPTLSE